MNLETKLNRIENKFDIIYIAILSLEEELDVDTMRDNFNLTEDAIEALEEIDSELVDVSIGFQRFWNDWTQVIDDERIYEYSDDEEA